MFKTLLTGTGILIAIYIGVSYATGAGRVIGAASGAYNSGVKVLQGR